MGLQLKTPYRDGTTHVVMTPLEFLQRLAALVPRPRLHLIRFHCVLAPHAALRAQIVPSVPNERSASGEVSSACRPARLSWAQLFKRIFEIDMTACSQCGGLVTLIATIDDLTVVAKVLAPLGLPTRAPPLAPAQADMVVQTAGAYLRPTVIRFPPAQALSHHSTLPFTHLPAPHRGGYLGNIR